MITIQLPQPDNIVAPWSQIVLATDFIGPFPGGTYWQISVDPAPEPIIPGIRLRIPFGSTNQGFILQPGEGDPLFSDWESTHAWSDGTQVHVNVQLVEGTGPTVDSGTATGPWQSTSQIALQPQGTTEGGLTPEQATQIDESWQSDFPAISLDTLTLEALTTGPSQGPVNAFLPNWVFGVIVRIAQVPPDLVAGTPDADYWTPSLAIVRVFRGSDLWMRVPVHTSSKIVSFYNDAVVVALTTVTPLQWLLNMSLQVTFRDGVTGEVFLMHHP